MTQAIPIQFYSMLKYKKINNKRMRRKPRGNNRDGKVSSRNAAHTCGRFKFIGGRSHWPKISEIKVPQMVVRVTRRNLDQRQLHRHGGVGHR